MRLAAALVMFTAGLTAAVMHHDEPTTTATPAAPHVEAIDIPRPNPTRVSRYQHRWPLRRHRRAKPPRVVTAPAPTAHDWSGVAACESGGDWTISTGNGFYGGLQFTLQTWLAFGGVGMPNQQPAAAQIAVAERVLAVQGAGAWPICSRYLTTVVR